MTPIYDLGTRYFNSPKRRYIFPRTFIARKTKLLIYYSLISMTKKKEKKKLKKKALSTS